MHASRVSASCRIRGSYRPYVRLLPNSVLQMLMPSRARISLMGAVTARRFAGLSSSAIHR